MDLHSLATPTAPHNGRNVAKISHCENLDSTKHFIRIAAPLPTFRIKPVKQVGRDHADLVDDENKLKGSNMA